LPERQLQWLVTTDMNFPSWKIIFGLTLLLGAGIAASLMRGELHSPVSPEAHQRFQQAEMARALSEVKAIEARIQKEIDAELAAQDMPITPEEVRKQLAWLESQFEKADLNHWWPQARSLRERVHANVSAGRWRLDVLRKVDHLLAEKTKHERMKSREQESQDNSTAL